MTRLPYRRHTPARAQACLTNTAPGLFAFSGGPVILSAPEPSPSIAVRLWPYSREHTPARGRERSGDTTWLLAADFDKAAWEDDLGAFAETCRRRQVPVLLERSRSCRGGHAWIFFTAPIHAGLARRLGAGLLTETQEHRPEVGMDSYDRLFPTQDSLPEGGFGNLIALPLQQKCRARGGSVFLDHEIQEVPDPWSHLEAMSRFTPEAVESLVRDLPSATRGLCTAAPSPPTLFDAANHDQIPTVSWTQPLRITLSDRLYIPTRDLPAAIKSRLLRFAAFENPVYYSNRRLHLSNHSTPRFISRAEEEDGQLVLPRGTWERVEDTLEKSKAPENMTWPKN